MLRQHRFTLSFIVSLFSLLLITGVAFAATVLTDDNGITGFELYANGIYWWSAGGDCNTGEFDHDSTIRLRATWAAETKSLAKDCTILEGENDNVVRDSAYIYFFQARQLQRKALLASEGEPAQPLAGAPPLPADQTMAALTLAEGNLYWSRFDTATGKSSLQRMAADGSTAPQNLILATGEVRKLVWKRYVDSNAVAVDALIWTTKMGALYRFALNKVGAKPQQLATGVVDFAPHDTYKFAASPITSIYAAQGSELVLPNSPPGKLLRINIDSGATTTVYTAAGKNQVVSVATDSANSDLVVVGTPPKSVYLVEAGITCGDLFCVPGNRSIWRHALPAQDDANWDLIVASGVGFNLRSNDQSLYYTNDFTFDRIEKVATDAPALELDLQADAVEVVQGIQSLNMDVQLVANKPTFARGYAHLATNTTGKTTWLPKVVLRGFLNGQELPGSPLVPLNNVGIDKTNNMATKRASLQQSFLFQLPDAWVANAGALTVQMQIDPEQTLPETGSKNNNTVGLLQPAALIAQQNLCLDTVRMYTANTIPPTPFKMTELVARTRSFLPVPALEVHASDTVIVKPVFHVEVQCYPVFGIPPVVCVPVPYFTDEMYNMAEDQDTAMT
ncbi:MAG: hypothetical protein M3Q45_12770, partial [Chloroflexota bacterium]|nr:hypothetical protein [Chloroflexota bacterium]